LTAFEASFYNLTFVEKTFSKIQNGGFFEDDVIFEKNRLFSKGSFPPLTQFFSKFSKSNLVVQSPKVYQKKLPNKIFQYGGYFQNGVCTFSYMKICLMIVILGLSCSFLGCLNIFLTFNHTKINFGFLDHPNMGLSYKIMINK
jgi:hypothetical protein